jgi:hypothetical protein
MSDLVRKPASGCLLTRMSDLVRKPASGLVLFYRYQNYKVIRSEKMTSISSAADLYQ